MAKAMNDSEFPPDDDAVLRETFKRASDFVTFNASLMKEDDLLYLYGRSKQALIGPCNEPMPGIFKFRNRSKWNAWNSLGNMLKEEAMRQYIDKLSHVKPDWDASKPKDEQRNKHAPRCVCFNPVVKELKPVFNYVIEGNIEKVRHLLTEDNSLKAAVDDYGWSLLHFACIKGHSEIVDFLIASGVDVNSRDEDGSTPLHNAASSGHVDILNMLLKAGADVKVLNSDGLSAADVAYSMSIEDMLAFST